MDVKELNRSPVQLLARKALSDLKLPLSPASLFSTQLMMQALDRGSHSLDPDSAMDLREQLDLQIASDNPELELRLVELDGDPLVDLQELQEAPPQEVATAFLLSAQQELASLQPREN